MKLYLNISPDQAKPTKRIISRQSNNTNRPALVIFNTDLDYGKYVQALARIMKGLGMVERSKQFSDVPLKKIQTGEFIVVGNENPWEDYDYEVMINQQDVENLDGRRFRKVYDIIDDWKEIVKKLSGYGMKNSARRCLCKLDLCEKREEFVRPIGINVVSREQQCNVLRQKRVVVQQYTPTRRDEKITIFETWVKIGFNQYDIYVDMFGNKYINHESGKKLYVAEDRYGRSFLVKR